MEEVIIANLFSNHNTPFRRNAQSSSEYHEDRLSVSDPPSAERDNS